MDHNRIRVAIATNSLGKSRAGHDIESKLAAAQRHGFQGIEVAMECLNGHADSDTFSSYDSRQSRLRAAAADIYDRATSWGLEIIALNPFGAFDGLADEKDVVSRLEEGELWLQLCDELHAPILQMTSCFYPVQHQKSLTADPKRIAENMKRLGLLAQKHDKIVALEGVSWGIDVNTWQQVRDILRDVDLDNVRHCVDTFHIAAVEAGDPFNATAPTRPDGMLRLGKSLSEMKATLKASDIAYFQLSDAVPADEQQRDYPVRDLNQPSFMTQSRNCRVFPGEGVLPVMPVAKAVFETGYRGWVSMEVFHPDHWKEEKSIPDQWAKRGMKSWEKVARHCFGGSPSAHL